MANNLTPDLLGKRLLIYEPGVSCSSLVEVWVREFSPSGDYVLLFFVRGREAQREAHWKCMGNIVVLEVLADPPSTGTGGVADMMQLVAGPE